MDSSDWNIQIIMDIEGQNIHIHNSHQVTKVQDMKMIIDTIMGKSFYAKMTDADFNRTKASMIREWKAHNILHKWNYQVYRTRSVDFNQNESVWRRFCYFFLSMLHKG
jgi:hypothetical protein